MTDFNTFFSESLCDSLKSIHLITTLKPNSIDQIKKVSSLISLIENDIIRNKRIQCKISINNKLHGKIYIFKKSDIPFAAIITSANLTDNGLYLNHEWGVELADSITIESLEKSNLNCIEPQYENVSFAAIYKMQKWINEYLEKQTNPLETIDLDLTEILTSSEGKNEDRKPIKQNPNRSHEYRITQQYLDTWNDYFQEFLVFKSKHNEVTVPRDYPNSSLYAWYRKQKVFYANDTIPLEHKELLEKVGFYFGDGHEIRWAKIWEENYGFLKAYYDEYGTSDVPHTRDNKDAFYSLGNWVAMQKTYYNDDILSEYKIERLNDLDFIWKKEAEYSPKNVAWQARIDELKKWKEIYGDCHVPQFNPDKTKNSLGKWLNDQRDLKRNGKKKADGTMRYLEEERVQLLLELGVDFDYEENKHKNSFEKQIQEFLSFRYQYPDLKPLYGEFKKERENLAQWRHKFDKLPEYKQKRLKELKII